MKTKVMKPNSSVQITIGNGYLDSLQKSIAYFSTLIDPTERDEQLQKMANNEELSEAGLHFKTLLVLLQTIENKVISENLIDEVELD